jgi:hypothetical protein
VVRSTALPQGANPVGEPIGCSHVLFARGCGAWCEEAARRFG